MKLNIHIDSDNDAFTYPGGGREVARILHQLADKFEANSRDMFDVRGGVLHDINGASVGTWNVEPSDDQEAHDSR